MNPPTPAALAVVLRGPDTLLVRRKNPPDAGLWGFPGGRVEPGETAFAAAARELLEETGVTAAPLEQIDTLDLQIPGADGGLRFHYRMAAIRCRYLGGTPQAADDALEAAWTDCNAVLGGPLALSENVDRVLRKALACDSS